MKKILILTILSLSGCLGPSLFTVNGFKITASDAITMPHKVQTLITKEKEK